MSGVSLTSSHPVLSPASGVVLALRRRPRLSTYVRIFISPARSHVVTSPVPALVTGVTRSTGARYPAFLSIARRRNARVRVSLADGNRQLTVVTYRGLLTGVMTPLIHVRESIAAGDPIVRLDFGSMVEVFGHWDMHPFLRRGRPVERGQEIGNWQA